MNLYPGPVPVDDLHRWKTEATQRLLGYTIALTEDEWHRPSRLPGWTRAHVATHLARSADYFRSVVSAAIAEKVAPPAPSAELQRRELEQGADRDGLALQIDLDAAAGALQGVIESVKNWEAPVTLDGEMLPLAALLLARLHGVNLHLIDLDCDFCVDAIPADSAEWLLRWTLYRRRNSGLPTMRITTDSLSATLGVGTAEPLEVHGSDVAVWTWLTGRTGPDKLTGADGLVLPLLG